MLTSAVCGDNRRLAVKRVVPSSHTLYAHGNCPHNSISAKPISDYIHRLVEFYHFLRIFKKPDLVTAPDKVAQPHPDQPDQNAALV